VSRDGAGPTPCADPTPHGRSIEPERARVRRGVGSCSVRGSRGFHASQLLAAGVACVAATALPGSSPAAPSGRFAPAQVYAVGTSTWPQWTAVGDLNGDGLSDVALATGRYSDPENDDKVFVFLQQPGGALGPPTRYDPSCAGPRVEIGDLDADGKADLVVPCDYQPLKVYHQSGGTLGPQETVPEVQSPASLVDVDRDGRNDLLAVALDGVSVFRNTAAGFVKTPVGPARGVSRAGDVTGDGRPTSSSSSSRRSASTCTRRIPTDPSPRRRRTCRRTAAGAEAGSRWPT
jgi:hypothetical protein